MIDVTKAIKKQVFAIECEILRRGCRIVAQKAKANGDYERTRKYNDLAYQGDCLLAQVKAW